MKRSLAFAKDHKDVEEQPHDVHVEKHGAVNVLVHGVLARKHNDKQVEVDQGT